MDVTVLLDSRHLPPMSFTTSGPASAGGGVADAVARFLRPRVRAQLGGATVVDVAPFGAPGPSTWPLLGIVAAAGVLVLVVLVVRGAAAFLRR